MPIIISYKVELNIHNIHTHKFNYSPSALFSVLRHILYSDPWQKNALPDLCEYESMSARARACSLRTSASALYDKLISEQFWYLMNLVKRGKRRNRTKGIPQDGDNNTMEFHTMWHLKCDVFHHILDVVVVHVTQCARKDGVFFCSSLKQKKFHACLCETWSNDIRPKVVAFCWMYFSSVE